MIHLESTNQSKRPRLWPSHSPLPNRQESVGAVNMALQMRVRKDDRSGVPEADTGSEKIMRLLAEDSTLTEVNPEYLEA